MRNLLQALFLGGVSVAAFAQPAREASEPLKFEGVEVGVFQQEMKRAYTTADGLPSLKVSNIEIQEGKVYAVTEAGVALFEGKAWNPAPDVQVPAKVQGHEDPGLKELTGADASAVQVAASQDGRMAAAGDKGLYLRKDGAWSQLLPSDGVRSWAPTEVRGVAFDHAGRLWFASPQGVGCLEGDKWTLYTGAEGLPFNDFTCVAAGEEGVVWFGTTMGAIRFDGKTWEYRQGPNWLPGDVINDIAVTEKGDAWIATDNGVGVIKRVSMTLAEKAAFYNQEIDKYHRRTPYGYVLEARLENPGDKSKWSNHDSDNDGLWTAMYGAAECFRYAATKAPEAKERAKKAFDALRFLSEVTQGGSHPAPPGFPARSILPVDGPNPNEQYTVERDRETQQRDPYWKIISPRWPTSADGKWYWKTDTSSDELDGHYFFYALYYDLVAETEEEKARVRETTLATTDHLLDHNYALVDHDGLPTRWAQYAPEVLNYSLSSGGRGLNSLSILSYLQTAYHMSGDEKYETAYRYLIDNHAYAFNTLIPKTSMGPGHGNHSDDEMAMMGYYNLFAYEDDPELIALYNRSLLAYWQLEAPEVNPLFNYTVAACLEGQNLGMLRRFTGGEMLTDALESLQRYRLDLINWPIKNSHRLDIVPLRGGFTRGGANGRLVNGKVLPVDERNFNHWNHDPWRLDYGGDGRELSDGAAFLLPYYMGLHHGYLIEKE